MIKLLNANQVAEALGVSKNRAYEIMRQSDFPSIKLSNTKKGSIRVTQEGLALWIENLMSQKEGA